VFSQFNSNQYSENTKKVKTIVRFNCTESFSAVKNRNKSGHNNKRSNNLNKRKTSIIHEMTKMTKPKLKIDNIT